MSFSGRLKGAKPPPPRGEGGRQWPVFSKKKKISFVSEGAERNRRLCFFTAFMHFTFIVIDD